MSDLNRIEQNNAELRECIEIAESLPDAPVTVDGWDIATMQKFVDSRGLRYLYYNSYPQNIAELDWLKAVDTSKVTNTSNMFNGAFTYLETVPLFDVSSVKDASAMFINAGLIKTIPCFHFKSPCDASHFTSAQYITECPIIMDECTNAEKMFSGCYRLIHFPTTINTSKSTSFEYMFQNCKALSGDVNLDMASAKRATYVFYQASTNTNGAALNVVLRNSHNVTSFYWAFNNCKNLVSLSLDMRSATSASGMLGVCSKLENLTLKNIKTDLQVSNGTSYGHLLTVDSLVGLCYELRDTGSVKTLTIGSANLAKLASVYVRLVEITDEMRAEDNLIDEKLPFERCESTDEGATLITNYVLSKNWSLV